MKKTQFLKKTSVPKRRKQLKKTFVPKRKNFWKRPKRKHFLKKENNSKLSKTTFEKEFCT